MGREEQLREFARFPEQKSITIHRISKGPVRCRREVLCPYSSSHGSQALSYPVVFLRNMPATFQVGFHSQKTGDVLSFPKTFEA